MTPSRRHLRIDAVPFRRGAAIAVTVTILAMATTALASTRYDCALKGAPPTPARTYLDLDPGHGLAETFFWGRVLKGSATATKMEETARFQDGANVAVFRLRRFGGDLIVELLMDEPKATQTIEGQCKISGVENSF
jgi:hypothetical protein